MSIVSTVFGQTQVNNLVRKFGDLTAVDDVSFTVEEGEIFGFLGPNGAGKTTTIRLMLGLIKPTSGTVVIFGHDVSRGLRDTLPRVGAMVENPAFYPYLSGKDNMIVMSRAAGLENANRIEDLLEMVGLLARADDKYETYSLGMKQRLAIAAALLNDPELILLDEPALGLDAAGIKQVRELLRHLQSAGKTLFVSSHFLHEVEQVCDKVAVIAHGRLVGGGEVRELLQLTTGLRLRLEKREKAKAILSEVDWVSSATEDGDYLVVEAPHEKAADLNALLAKEGLYLSELTIRSQTLEDYFLSLTGGA
jgi:ABC-2 type transport system ATP-binding protein